MAAKFGNFRVLQIPDRPLPKKVDLRPWMSEVENQEDLGSWYVHCLLCSTPTRFDHCSTANAFAGVLEYLINRKYRQKIDVSRLFIYYNARRLQHEDRTIQDSGTTPYHSADALRKYGDCDEDCWPYKSNLVNQRPSREAYDKAKQYTVVPVRMSFQMKAFKKALAEGYPVILGVILLDSAGTEARENGGRIVRPDPRRTTVRNTQWHAVVCVGYDDEAREFIVRNSWGKDWVRSISRRSFSSETSVRLIIGAAWVLPSAVCIFRREGTGGRSERCMDDP